MASKKGLFNCLWMLTKLMLSVSTENTFDEAQKRLFLLLSEDTNKKRHFWGEIC